MSQPATEAREMYEMMRTASRAQWRLHLPPWDKLSADEWRALELLAGRAEVRPVPPPPGVSEEEWRAHPYLPKPYPPRPTSTDSGRS